MTSVGLSSTSDVVTFDQNWHYLYSSSAGGKDLGNDYNPDQSDQLTRTCRIRGIPKNLREKLSKISCDFYSMVNIAHLNEAFSEIFTIEASPAEGQSRRDLGNAKT